DARCRARGRVHGGDARAGVPGAAGGRTGRDLRAERDPRRAAGRGAGHGLDRRPGTVGGGPGRGRGRRLPADAGAPRGHRGGAGGGQARPAGETDRPHVGGRGRAGRPGGDQRSGGDGRPRAAVLAGVRGDPAVGGGRGTGPPRLRGGDAAAGVPGLVEPLRPVGPDRRRGGGHADPRLRRPELGVRRTARGDRPRTAQPPLRRLGPGAGADPVRRRLGAGRRRDDDAGFLPVRLHVPDPGGTGGGGVPVPGRGARRRGHRRRRQRPGLVPPRRSANHPGVAAGGPVRGRDRLLRGPRAGGTTGGAGDPGRRPAGAGGGAGGAGVAGDGGDGGGGL
ncbi:MAG: hypothetical protein AVDCRST_MAG73-2189, partial [uncultured Thermomicrobiales bacterium]